MQGQKIFRCSDSDLSAFLLLNGYQPSNIEIKKDKRHFNKIKAFACFDGNIDEFINLQDIYKNNTVQINLRDFSIARQTINKLIKEEISKQQP